MKLHKEKKICNAWKLFIHFYSVFAHGFVWSFGLSYLFLVFWSHAVKKCYGPYSVRPSSPVRSWGLWLPSQFSSDHCDKCLKTYLILPCKVLAAQSSFCLSYFSRLPLCFLIYSFFYTKEFKKNIPFICIFLVNGKDSDLFISCNLVHWHVWMVLFND